MTGSLLLRSKPKNWPIFSLKRNQQATHTMLQASTDKKNNLGLGKKDLNMRLLIESLLDIVILTS